MDGPIELFKPVEPSYLQLGIHLSEPKLMDKVSAKFIILFVAQSCYYVASITFALFEATTLTEYAAVFFLVLTMSATFYLNLKMLGDWPDMLRMIKKFDAVFVESK